MGKQWKQWQTLFIFFLGGVLKITPESDCSHEIKRRLLLGRKAMKNLDSILKSRDIVLPTGLSSQSYGFSSSHVWIWELDYKKSWASKNWCFWTVVLMKTLESPLDCKEIKPVSPKENQSWIFISTDAEAETPILWPPNAESWLIGKDPYSVKDWWQEEKGPTEDEIGWMESPTLWTWVSVSSWKWWSTGKPGMLQSMGVQIVGHDWVTEKHQCLWQEFFVKFQLNPFSCISEKSVSLMF